MSQTDWKKYESSIWIYAISRFNWFLPPHSFLGYVTRKKAVTAIAAVRRRARDEL